MKFINTVLSASLLFTLSSQGLLAEETQEIKKLNEKILELERLIEQDLSQSTPSKAIMAFYTEKCPTGWLPADGQNETPDLRGEFIRGWDRGRGVDKFYELDKDLKATSKERLLGSWQAPTLITTAIGHDVLVQPYINGTRINGEEITKEKNAALPKEFHSGIQTDPVEDNWYSWSFTGALYAPADFKNLFPRSNIPTPDKTDIQLLNTPERKTVEEKVEINHYHFGGTRPRNVALLYCMKE